MSDDLLRHVIGPLPYSSWILWLAIALSVVLVGWFVGVLAFTAPGRQLRGVPLVGAVRDRMMRHRFARAVHDVGARYRSGAIGAAQAGADVSRYLRTFLQRASGVPAEYMQVDAIADSEIATAAELLEQLTDVQFNASSRVDAGRAADDAEELIRSWT